MTTYRATCEIPELVQRALALAAETGFTQSCTPEVGRLLRVLAAQVRGGVIGEIGTGCGVGTAWMASALPSTTRLVTVELDAERAAAVRALLRPCPGVTVLAGDWHALLPYGPFDLLFADGGKAKEREPETLLRALRPGGLVVLDDLTPEEHWPPEWRGQPDPVRQFWLNDPRLLATELLVTPTASVILATRRPGVPDTGAGTSATDD
ncbi:MAG: class I SAM-dependent methyltransferase [Sphaerobacter sp.]|nr:class I SAM-dependent methyltransferase [Sphaerobacter sp.]